MSSSYPSPTMQHIRIHARQRYWKKLDEIVETLIGVDASPTNVEKRL